MIRWLVIAAVFFVLYKLISNEFADRITSKKKTENFPGQKAPTGDMVKDPICGSYVDAASSISVRDGADVYRFCGYECRDAFLENIRATGRNIPPKAVDTEAADAENEQTDAKADSKQP